MQKGVDPQKARQYAYQAVMQRSAQSGNAAGARHQNPQMMKQDMTQQQLVDSQMIKACIQKNQQKVE